jgi:hypothetical protein
MNTKITKGQFIQAATALIAVIALILGMFGVFADEPADNEATARGTSNFDTLQVANGSAGSPSLGFSSDPDTGLYRSAANTLGFSGGGSSLATLSSTALTLADGSLVVPDFVRLSAQTAISVTNGAVFTPTGSYQPLTSAGTVTPTLSSSTSTYAAGHLLFLENQSNTSIVMVDTGNIVMAGNLTLGQRDTLTLLFDGTRWVERARTNN